MERIAGIDTVGRRLKYIRKKEKMSQKEFVDHIGFASQGTYSGVENDRRKPIQTLLDALEAHGYNVEWILYGDKTNEELTIDADKKTVIEIMDKMDARYLHFLRDWAEMMLHFQYQNQELPHRNTYMLEAMSEYERNK